MTPELRTTLKEDMGQRLGALKLSHGCSPGSVESGSDFWCRCALQGREQPGGAGVRAADWCFLIPSLAEKHTGFLLRAAGEFITSPLTSVCSEDCRK